MSETKLSAQPRTVTGRKIKGLRREGQLPANVFGKDVKSQAIQLTYSDFNKAYQESGETGIINLSLDGEKETRPVLISSIHFDPITDLPLHVDFRQVNLKQKINTNIPIEIIGESPAVKNLGGVLVTMLDEIEVEALPTDLPDKIEVDISVLTELGSNLTAGDLKLSSKLELKTDPETAMVSVQAPKEEEEVVEEVAATEEEAAGESKEDAKPEEKSEDKKE